MTNATTSRANATKKGKQCSRSARKRQAPPTVKVIPPIPNHPSLTQLRIDAILSAIRTGDPLYLACEANGVSDDTWYNACSDTPWLDSATTRARECRGDRYSHEVLLASKGQGDYHGLPVDERRLIADNLKWTAARMAPKRWGDKLELTGALSLPTPEQVQQRLKQLADEERRLLEGGK